MVPTLSTGPNTLLTRFQHRLQVQVPFSLSNRNQDTFLYHSVMSNTANNAPTVSVTTATITYAISPGQTVTGLYDYSTNKGVKQWAKSTKILDNKP